MTAGGVLLLLEYRTPRMDTPREYARKAVSRLRDRRRRERKRLEEIFDRQTFTSVAVMGAMGKLLEVSVVPFLDPTTGVSGGRAGAWAVVFVAAVAASVYWEHLSRAAQAAADAAEDATSGGENGGDDTGGGDGGGGGG